MGRKEEHMGGGKRKAHGEKRSAHGKGKKKSAWGERKGTHGKKGEIRKIEGKTVAKCRKWKQSASLEEAHETREKTERHYREEKSKHQMRAQNEREVGHT